MNIAIETPFVIIVVLVITAIVLIALTTSSQAGEQEEEQVLENSQIPFIKTIGHIVRVTQEPEIDVSCSPGIEQTLYTVELKETKVKFLEKEMEQKVYVSILYKGARAVAKVNPLDPEVEQLLSSPETPGVVKFVNMISEEPPPILKNDVGVHSGEIAPLQTLYLNNHMVTLQRLEDRRLSSTGPLEFLTGGRCTATVRFQCSSTDISLVRLYLQDDNLACQDQENPEYCEKYINPCKVVAKVKLDSYADATESCGERKPIFHVLGDKTSDWKIGEPLWIIFWRDEEQYKDCWKKERFDPDDRDRCDLAYLGADKFAVPPSSYKTGCV